MAKKSIEIVDAEAKICCGCPYPKCVEERGAKPIKCDYFDAKAKEIREKYRKGAKGNAVDKRNFKPSTQAV